MTRIDWFEKGYAREALYLGILDLDMFGKFTQYKLYQSYSQGRKKTEAVKMTAYFCHTSESTVWKNIRFFEKSPLYQE